MDEESVEWKLIGWDVFPKAGIWDELWLASAYIVAGNNVANSQILYRS